MKFKSLKSGLLAIGLVITSKDMPLLAATDSSTIAGIKVAQWGSNVQLTYSDNSFTFVSNGIPNHARPAEYALPKPEAMPGTKLNAFSAYAGADPTAAQNYNFTIPLNPAKRAKPTSTSMGPIGAMISGAVLFNPYEGNGGVATMDNFSVKNSKGEDVYFLDTCNGHPQPMMGTYHYHALPTCITQVVDKEGGPSHLIGVAFDGFPIYGNRAMDGSKITATQLDACNGITSPTPEFPDGIYHYVLLDTKDSTSSIRCFSGTSSVTMRMPGMPGRPRPSGLGKPPSEPGGPGMSSPPGLPP